MISPKSVRDGQRNYLVKPADLFLLKDLYRRVQEMFPDMMIRVTDDINEFVQNYSGGNLFDERNCIAVLDPLTKDNIEGLSELLEQGSGISLIVERDTMLKNKQYTKLKAACELIDIKPCSDSEAAVWVKKWLDDSGLRHDLDIPSYLVDRIGNDLWRLHNEVRKIILRYSGGQSISRTECEQVTATNPETKYYTFMDHFIRRRTEESIAFIQNLDEYYYIKLLHFIISQIHKILEVSVYKDQGLGEADISDMVGISKYIIKTKFFVAISFYGRMKLMKLLDLFNELDVDIRLSRFPKFMVFSSYILKAHQL